MLYNFVFQSKKKYDVIDKKGKTIIFDNFCLTRRTIAILISIDSVPKGKGFGNNISQ